MVQQRRSVRELVRDARSAVQDVLAHRERVNAFDLLQERDSEGNPAGRRPYTDEALREFASASKHNSGDINLVHHLAIAYHARAWDMELRGDPRAADEWVHALDCWYEVEISGEFWENLKDKLLSCDANADPAPLTDIRENLLENLLVVHIDFIRHYSEGNSPERALSHIEVIKRARIPLAVKKQLEEKIFGAMAGTLSDAQTTQAALTNLERFFALFSDYLPALRRYAEISAKCVSTMLDKGEWRDITDLDSRVKSHIRRLASHPELASQPLAQAALEELASQFTLAGSREGTRHAICYDNTQEVSERDSARKAFDLAVEWGRIGITHSPTGSDLRTLLTDCLVNRGILLHREAGEVLKALKVDTDASNWEEDEALEADTDARTILRAAENLWKNALEDMQEAGKYKPDNEIIQRNMRVLQEKLDVTRNEINRRDLMDT